VPKNCKILGFLLLNIITFNDISVLGVSSVWASKAKSKKWEWKVAFGVERYLYRFNSISRGIYGRAWSQERSSFGGSRSDSGAYQVCLTPSIFTGKPFYRPIWIIWHWPLPFPPLKPINDKLFQHSLLQYVAISLQTTAITSKIQDKTQLFFNSLLFSRRFSCYGSEESGSSSWLIHGATPTVSYESWLSSQCSSSGAEFGRSESQTSAGSGEGSVGQQGAEGVAQEWRRGRSRARNACAATTDSNSDISRYKNVTR